MKKYMKKLMVLVMVLAAVSCSEDFLDTAPTNAVSPSNALSTPANMMVALNGVHRTMYSQSPLDGYSYAGEGFILPFIEFPGSDALHTTSGNGWFRSAIQWRAHTDGNRADVEWVWYHYYHIIGSVNAIINAAEGMTEDELLSNVLGQAKAYRAFAHFRLVTLWGKSYRIGNPQTDLGVPIMLSTEAPYEGKARNTVAEVYAQIEKDLDEAIEHFKHASARPNKSHINLEVAQGLRARVALTKGDWEIAATMAHEARKNYSLMDEAEYKSGFNSVDGTEWMWGGHIVPDQTTYYRAWFYYIGTNFNGTQNRTNPKIINKKLYDLIPDTDYRKDLWDPKAPNTIAGWENDPNYDNADDFWAAYDAFIAKYQMTSRFNTHPYQSVKFRNKNGGTIDPDDVLYMRASEMYLIEAEALAHISGREAEAAQVLYELVSKRDSGYTLSTKTGDALLDEIKIQRRIELWGEGHRWLDMLRWDEELDRTDTGASASLYQNGFKQAKPSVNDNWLWQIPQSELDANPNMVQNPAPNL